MQDIAEIAAAITMTLPKDTAVTKQEQYADDDGRPNLWLTVSGNAKAQYVAIPVEAIPDRRKVYDLPACTTNQAPGGYCTAAPYCAACQQAIQKCLDEHVDAGRL